MNILEKAKLIVILSIPATVLLSQPSYAQDRRTSSDDLLKMALHEANTLGNTAKAIELCKRALRQSPDYADVHQLLGRLYRVSGETDLSRQEYLLLLKKHPRDTDALISLYNLESEAKRYDAALAYINQALQVQPGKEDFLFRKAYLLEEMKRLEEAVLLSEGLYKQFPGNEKYSSMYCDQLFQLSREQVSMGNTGNAIRSLQRLLEVDPQHRDALIALVNHSYASGQIDQAIRYCELGLAANPVDSVFLLKQSAFLIESGKPVQAIEASSLLARSYPGNERFANIYYDQLLGYGVGLMKLDSIQPASAVWARMHADFPKDTAALQYLSANMIREKRYDSALGYIEKGLLLMPASYKFQSMKTEALEAKGEYAKAYESARQMLQSNPGDVKLRSHVNYLQYKSKRNQIGVMHLQSIYDNDIPTASITTLQYLRFHKKGSIGGRINFADRNNQQGLQIELESYLKHNQYLYSYMVAGWASNDVLPQWRAGYSLFKNLGKNWEGELGARYLYAGGENVWSGVWSASKTWKKNWTNFRGYIINDAGEWYHAYTLTSRFFLKKPNEYVSFIGGLGTSPDDRSRNFQINSLLGFLAHSAGMGIQKTIKTNTIVNLTGVWTNQRIAEKQSYNQYDITFTLLQMF